MMVVVAEGVVAGAEGVTQMVPGWTSTEWGWCTSILMDEQCPMRAWRSTRQPPPFKILTSRLARDILVCFIWLGGSE